MIETHTSEVMESLGTTVAIKHTGPGEFKADYWNEVNRSFTSVHNIDPDHSYVDADNITRMRYFHAEFKRTNPEDLGLSREAVVRLKEALTVDDYTLLRSLLRKAHRGILTQGFVAGCANQARNWAEGASTHSSPLSKKQWQILKKASLND